uniref:Neurotransmitter-gated ion-channel ligand-binding domain-containing protein n=1 Tax=Romanomermis culicivorax TaxID=13658 RepID=A0A915I8A7_ROMCU
MTIQLWALQAWKDENLAWDPADFGGIDQFVVSENDIWTPDINLENNLRPNYLLNERRTGVTVKILHPEELQKWQKTLPLNGTFLIDQDENGAMMFFSYPVTYKFMCHMNVAMFPFDTQTCSMVFGSWNYFDDQLRFWPFNYDNTFLHSKTHLKKLTVVVSKGLIQLIRRNACWLWILRTIAGSWDVDLEGFTNNSQWTVVSFKMEPVVIRSDVSGRFHACVRATIVLKRQAITYMVTLICPTLLTTFSSLVGFFMPTSSEGQRREKMTLGINSLLTMSILLMGVSDQVPCTSTSLPLIGRRTETFRSKIQQREYQSNGSIQEPNL